MNEKTENTTTRQLIFLKTLKTGLEYKICLFKAEGVKEGVRIIGNFQAFSNGKPLRAGTAYEVTHTKTQHPVFKTFKLISFSIPHGTTEEQLVNLFKALNIQGVGRVKATKIWEALGSDAVKKINEDPSCLNNLGFSNSVILEITKKVQENFKEVEILNFLTSVGISAHFSAQIFKKLPDAVAEIKKNPYILAKKINRFGFTKADLVALALGIEKTDLKRAEEAIFHVISAYSIDGHSYYTKDTLIQETETFLKKIDEYKISEYPLKTAIDNLIFANRLFFEDGFVYLPEVYKAEVNVAKILNNIFANNTNSLPSDYIDKQIKIKEKENAITYTEDQIKAIKMALTNSLSFITGGPGTGKTTILKAVNEIYLEYARKDTTNNFKINNLLLAPTGRAARRIYESTGDEASTIHSALEWIPAQDDERSYYFKRNENQRFTDIGLIIVDEASMLDIRLADALLRAIDKNTKVVFIGDGHQLPSIQPGLFLTDSINSKCFPVTTLNQICRQSKDSGIVPLISALKNKEVNETNFKNYISKDLSMGECSAEYIRNNIVNFLQLCEKQNIDIYQDFQILIPMKEGECGVHDINKICQNYFIPYENRDRFLEIRKDSRFYINDKLMITKNYPDHGVMNGDIGKVVDIQAKTFVLKIGDNLVSLPVDIKEDTELAYASTIHKSQGSEYKLAVVILLSRFYIILTNELLYTAVSRAKEKLFIIGEPSQLKMCTVDEQQRNSTLIKRIVEQKEEIAKLQLSEKEWFMNVYDFVVKTQDNQDLKLDIYKGKVLLIVNTATRCGFTKQYTELEELYLKYKDQGFVILDFPCNQFLMQAPGTDSEIHNFCVMNFNTTFPQFSKIKVNGKDAIELYKYLKEVLPGGRIKWNFTKFLVNRQGDVIQRFGSKEAPLSFEEKIKSALSTSLEN